MILDYEQKYKEALEKAKKWRNAPNIDKIPTFGNRIIEELFPELRVKESEGERIRKRIIECLKGNMPDNEYRREYISWLEKQGEQKSPWNEEDEKSLSDALWCCEKVVSIAKDENEMGTIWYAERWLKSLKSRL